jgi:hypothetical protein
MNLRRTATVLALALPFTTLVGCGGDELPTKAEFISQLEAEAKTEFNEQMKAAGLDEDTADGLFTEMAGCVYDKVAENEDTLRAVFDDSSSAEFNKVMEDKAAPCLEDFTTKVTDALTGAATGG